MTEQPSRLAADLHIVTDSAGRRVVHDERPLADPSQPIVDQGLAFDTITVGRRAALGLFGGVLGAMALAACSPSSTSSGSSASASASATSGASAATSPSASASTEAVEACESVIPEETAGPYPGDGSNGPNVLTESGVVREDITASFGSASGVADGVPLTIELRIQDADNGCAAFAGAAVYLWQCDAAGQYSLYSEAIADENYLRGVQEADADGVVRFTSIVPGCYAGRWPHIHFEVYESLAAAADVAEKIATSQIAIPQATSEAVYSDARYDGSSRNLSQVTLASDNVFGEDSAAQQLAMISGDVSSGFHAALVVPVSRETQAVTDGAGGGAPGAGGGGGGAGGGGGRP